MTGEATIQTGSTPTTVIATVNADEMLSNVRDEGVEPTADALMRALWTTTPFPTAVTGPIYSQTDAEDRAMALLPSGITPTDVEVSFLSFEMFENWIAGNSHAALVVRASWSDNGPVWLVAFLATGLAFEDIAPSLRGTQGSLASPNGGYYGFDANSGDHFASGAIISGVPPSFTQLTAVPTSNATIAAATEPPDATHVVITITPTSSTP